MTKIRLPVDEVNAGEPTELEWAASSDAFERHLAVARKSPRFTAGLAEVAEHQATLRDLRRAQELTQATVAEALGMTQSELSKLERRDDLRWSTLRRFVEATGGELHLIATYPGRSPVELRNPHFPLVNSTDS
jgi:DNA-binding transcriptional regulator YiaG